MNEMESLYQQLILEHSKARHGCRELPGWSASSHQINPTCGDEVTVQVEVTGNKLTNLAWDGHGCSISQASLSMMWDLVHGKDLDAIAALDADFKTMMHSRGGGVADEVLDRLEDASSLEGVSKYVNRIKCALLGWMALKDALAQALTYGESGVGEGANPHCCAAAAGETQITEGEA